MPSRSGSRGCPVTSASRTVNAGSCTAPDPARLQSVGSWSEGGSPASSRCAKLALRHAMLLQEVLAALETITPLRYAEAWDNVGLLTGDPAASVERVLLTIDLTHAVLGEAIGRRAELVVAYHPALF